ncbi:FAP50 [Symbiodinium sp. KB8]|nr:FAP50 [Symbiodinium sp. KB8]
MTTKDLSTASLICLMHPLAKMADGLYVVRQSFRHGVTSRATRSVRLEVAGHVDSSVTRVHKAVPSYRILFRFKLFRGGLPVREMAAPPKLLRIRTGEKNPSCDGHYELQPTRANGEPLWKNRDGERWLYFSAAGYWYIEGKVALDQNFNCAQGFIRQSARTADLPHTLRSLWQFGDGKDDPAITVEEATAEAAFTPRLRSGTSPQDAGGNLPQGPAGSALRKKAEQPAAAAEETFPDGKDAVPGMFSARFDGGDIEHKFRRVHKILQAHNFPVLMVDAGVGDDFGKLTQKYLNQIEKEKGVLICVCTAHYAEKTSSPFSSFEELQFAQNYRLDVLPLKVADVYPPKPPGGPDHPHDQDCEAEALIKMIFRPNLSFKDCRNLDEMEIARVIAEKLLKKKLGLGHG